MRIAFFYHSIVSDWNNGNAHFLRGVVTELQSRGHEVFIFEPRNGWSLENLIAAHGIKPVKEFKRLFPSIHPLFYDPQKFDLEEHLSGMDLVIAHEWNDSSLLKNLGRLRLKYGGFKLLFHDTHHRCFFSPGLLKTIELHQYDGVLAFGEVLRDFYLNNRLAQRAWTWHEAADMRLFYPRKAPDLLEDVVWIGNWGDGERSSEFETYLLDPIRSIGLKAVVHGVRYPPEAIKALAGASIRYAGWLPNYRVPEIFAGFRLTIHMLRRPYVESLKGIPTIRAFEALASGIPLICTPWEDSEGLFTQGRDYLMARSNREMKQHIRDLLHDRALAGALASHGRKTILRRHTCAHRVDELIAICKALGIQMEQTDTHQGQTLYQMAGKK